MFSPAIAIGEFATAGLWRHSINACPFFNKQYAFSGIGNPQEEICTTLRFTYTLLQQPSLSALSVHYPEDTPYRGVNNRTL